MRPTPNQMQAEFDRIHRELESLFHLAAQKSGLSDSAFAIFATLCQQETPVTQREICHRWQLSKQTVSTSIHNLEEGGYLRAVSERARDRGYLLTERGLEAAQERVVPVILAQQRAFDALSPDERITLLNLSQRLLSAFGHTLSPLIGTNFTQSNRKVCYSMNKVITISREFGSGGRELGKRLAEQLGIAYYDREIVTAISQKSGLAETYVESITEKGVSSYYPITYGRTFGYSSTILQEQITVMVEQRKILQELAEKSDCVIVGRCADVILEEFNPFRLFVYADIESRIARCQKRDSASEHLSKAEIKKQIVQVDKGRVKARSLFSDLKWGDKAGYQLCINTGGMSIKSLIPAIISCQEAYFSNQ